MERKMVLTRLRPRPEPPPLPEPPCDCNNNEKYKCALNTHKRMNQSGQQKIYIYIRINDIYTYISTNVRTIEWTRGKRREKWTVKRMSAIHVPKVNLYIHQHGDEREKWEEMGAKQTRAQKYSPNRNQKVTKQKKKKMKKTNCMNEWVDEAIRRRKTIANSIFLSLPVLLPGASEARQNHNNTDNNNETKKKRKDQNTSRRKESARWRRNRKINRSKTNMMWMRIIFCQWLDLSSYEIPHIIVHPYNLPLYGRTTLHEYRM